MRTKDINMNNVVVSAKGTPVSIAQHFPVTGYNDRQWDTQEIALINLEDETGSMPIYHFGSTLDSLIETLIQIREDIEEGKWS